MSKKKKAAEIRRDPEAAADYYKLKTQAVKDLVEANEENSPPVSRAELNKYKSGLKLRIPDIVKILFIKWWFAAVVCYFCIWGLGITVQNMLDRLFITGVALGIVTDILTNNALRFFEPEKGRWSKWINFYEKRYATFLLNILYAFADLALVFLSYAAINYFVMAVRHLDELSAYVGVEPILFGLLYLGYDMLFVSMRNLMRDIVRDARKPGR